ncbi:MAG: electron transfer flavoprotein subunit alpha/FixB family protein [Parasporobacterium sp.]|nr:electron transfer flavoprotein subunit alpha/FixB family protein [Parasporobacterium sp.]
MKSVTAKELAVIIYTIIQNKNYDYSNNFVISLGRGSIRHFEKAYELANDLKKILQCGRIRASRALIASGFMEMRDLVGISGEKIESKIYLAIGISGSIQHQAGLKNADMIIAINIDKEAPIFRAAEYGIYGDLFEVLPSLLKELHTICKQDSL